MTELLPCPFCGGRADVFSNPVSWEHCENEFCPNEEPDHVGVKCSSCEVQFRLSAPSRQCKALGLVETVRRWNQRVREACVA